ncbi:Arm DNA-binding domain-containing protein [Bradyrhizobium sp. Arg816]|uniref:Arm DNA-binding domain-containing protein n=1 Tax=Bradyrhizobium sp. Arg816 TaxID=2998491 RepID=UPI00249E7DE2|nr:Arm DNA-binding domain-containing protein [Bradyrhizobium sp. Arg816]MDI3564426.1 Arm DNA-binding domain-containing protein [Bradyrhizobium sp. Arg816]
MAGTNSITSRVKNTPVRDCPKVFDAVREVRATKHANPRQIRTDVDCRAARPKLENGARSATKISDATGGGLYLLITPDLNRPGKAGSRLWRMAYRFRGRQKTYSIGPYGNGNDGTVSLATACQKCDAAKALLAQDPRSIPRSKSNSNGIAKQLSARSARGSKTG